uniref:Uncharacterized protein n=1 Tax=Mus musculus TaxID=10090 RepID=Q3UMG0_MOUSE|nr:unnamed protein product [Mus musculus]
MSVPVSPVESHPTQEGELWLFLQLSRAKESIIIFLSATEMAGRPCQNPVSVGFFITMLKETLKIPLLLSSTFTASTWDFFFLFLFFFETGSHYVELAVLKLTM